MPVEITVNDTILYDVNYIGCTMGIGKHLPQRDTVASWLQQDTSC